MHPESISLGAIFGSDHMRSVEEFTVSSWLREEPPQTEVGGK